MTATPDIFLSYNREDQAVAKRFADAFAAEGLSVWWDTALRSGEAYDEVTEAALRGAKAVVVLWSPRSVVSRWVRAEATIADRCKTLVPVTIEACERPIMFELTQTADLTHWTGDAGDRAWLAFLGDVRGFVAKEAAPVAAAPATPVAAPTVEETLKPGQSGSAPSLAVLPFTNRSALPEDEVFAEGMVADVISALSQGVNVRVLGSTATANLSRAAIPDIASVGRMLGVRYLLEGNVRRIGINLRVTTQLLEAATGEVVWTARFDRPLTELAELQEELITEVATSLDAQVYSLEMEKALKKPSDLTAWEAVMRSWGAYRNWESSNRELGIREAKRAIAIAPDYAPGHAMLAVTLADDYLIDSDDPAQVRLIRSIADRAVELTPDDGSVLGMVGFALCYIGYAAEGVRHTGRAVRKAPGSGLIHYQHGTACYFAGQPQEAASQLQTAVLLSPGWHLMWAVKAYLALTLGALGRWHEADAIIDETAAEVPTYALGYVIKALCYRQLGRDAQAHDCITTARGMDFDLARAERFFGRGSLNSANHGELMAAIRKLYAPTKPGA